jgi:TonB family protein
MSPCSQCSHAKSGEARKLLAKFWMVVALMFLVALTAATQEGRRTVSNPQPEYPEIARKMNLSGVVKIEVVIGPDGQIKNAKVVGGHPVLADATLKALKNWKYAPGSAETKEMLLFKF